MSPARLTACDNFKLTVRLGEVYPFSQSRASNWQDWKRMTATACYTGRWCIRIPPAASAETRSLQKKFPTTAFKYIYLGKNFYIEWLKMWGQIKSYPESYPGNKKAKFPWLFRFTTY
jgi:hypothetical protein